MKIPFSKIVQKKIGHWKYSIQFWEDYSNNKVPLWVFSIGQDIVSTGHNFHILLKISDILSLRGTLDKKQQRQC